MEPYRLFLLPVLGFCLAAPAAGQEVAVTCRPRASELAIHYRAVEPSKRADAGAQVINFDSLVMPRRCPRDGPCMITGLKSRTLSCNLRGAAFRMVFAPVPVNENRQGKCGAAVTGEVEIFRNGKLFLQRTVFEPGVCYHEEEPYISLIRVAPGMESAEIEFQKHRQ